MSATLTTLVSFNGLSANTPSGPLIADANGDLFGTTQIGGTYGAGTAFEIVNNGTVANPNYASTPTILANFSGGDALVPEAGFIMDANGDLIGTSESGGANFEGSVFAILNTGSISHPTYSPTPVVLASFNGANGYNVASGLISDANGDLFGTAQQGGANANGTVFEIKNNGTAAAPNYASTPVVIANLNGNTGGSWPTGGLITDANGDLIGTGSRAGANNDGTVFEIKNNGTVANPNYAATPTTLVTFNGTNGADPLANMVADANGNLFGTTAQGGFDDSGTVFEIKNNGTAANPNYAATPTVLYQFDYGDGRDPESGLIVDANGDLFGTTYDGGLNLDGEVFEIKNNGTAANPHYATSLTILATFNDNNGSSPLGSLIADAYGNLFGTTTGGGARDDGSVFEIKGSGFAVLATPTISGTVQEGQTLTATTSNNVSSYQWQVFVGGTWSNITGATTSTFVVQSVDDGRQLRVIATDSFGNTATSAATTAVLDASGNQSVYDADNGSVIGNGQIQYVFGTATNTTVNSGGEQNIYAGGTAVGATINTGGQQIDWGGANNSVITGGIEYVYGTATGTTINAGTQAVAGVANNSTINSGGEQDLYSSSSASGTIIAGGAQYVYGASVDQTTIDNGGLQYLHGTATNTVINNGGEQNVYADGAATGTTINAGGQEVDWGSDGNATINGGTQFVAGIATGAVVNSGTQYVENGGVANGTTISGGTERVWSGGTADDVTFGGPSGTLVLDQASGLTGSIAGFQTGDAIDLSFLSFGPGTTLGYSANPDNTGGTLTVADGTKVVTLALLGQYTATSFALASDGNGGTSITDPAATSQNQLAVPLHG